MTICLVVKADLFFGPPVILHPHICSMHNFLCITPFILNLTFCPLALEKYVYVSNPPSNEKKEEEEEEEKEEE